MAIAYYGTYTAEEAAKTLLVKLEGSTYANLLGGPPQKRIITTLTEDELHFTNPGRRPGDPADRLAKSEGAVERRSFRVRRSLPALKRRRRRIVVMQSMVDMFSRFPGLHCWRGGR